MSTSTLPFELRIHSLEAKIYGDKPGSGSAGHAESSRTIQARLRDIEEALERAAQSSDALKRLMDGYQQYLPLLSLDDARHQGLNAGENLTESDLLPDSTKLTMVLEAARDVKDAERALRDIELLKQQGVDGAGSLEELLPYKQDLITGIEAAQSRLKQLQESRREVSDLLRRYHDFTTVVSDLFLELHHRIEKMEAAVARQESKQRKERASHY